MQKTCFIFLAALVGLFVFCGNVLAQDSLNMRCLDQIAHVGWGTYAYDVAINGDWAYISSWGNGVSIADISNPAQLGDSGSFYPPC
jgi:hypothetical protein